MLQNFHGYVPAMHQENDKKETHFWAPDHAKKGTLRFEENWYVQFTSNYRQPVKKTYKISRLWDKTSNIYSNYCEEIILCCAHPHGNFHSYWPSHNSTFQQKKIIQQHGKTFIWLCQSPLWSVYWWCYHRHQKYLDQSMNGLRLPISLWVKQ